MSDENWTPPSEEEHFNRHLQPIMDMIAKGDELPWFRPWKCFGSAPANLISGREYKGLTNRIVLSIQGYSSRFWVTRKKAEEFGGKIIEGEKPTYVFFWKRYIYDDISEDTGEVTKKARFYARTYEVYNVEQTEGIIHPRVLKPDFEKVEHEPFPDFDNFVENYCSGKGPDLKYGGDKACYIPSKDLIKVPESYQYDSYAHHCSTVFHELVHSTGPKGRLNRRGITEVNTKDQDLYGREELIAEMGAALLMSEFGFTEAEFESVRNNTAAYLQHWSKVIGDDPRMFITAARQAEKAVEYLKECQEIH